jgi:hypothetical protein
MGRERIWVRHFAPSHESTPCATHTRSMERWSDYVCTYVLRQIGLGGTVSVQSITRPTEVIPLPLTLRKNSTSQVLDVTSGVSHTTAFLPLR